MRHIIRRTGSRWNSYDGGDKYTPKYRAETHPNDKAYG